MQKQLKGSFHVSISPEVLDKGGCFLHIQTPHPMNNTNSHIKKEQLPKTYSGMSQRTSEHSDVKTSSTFGVKNRKKPKKTLICIQPALLV